MLKPDIRKWKILNIIDVSPSPWLIIPAKDVDSMIESGEIRASETITFIKIGQLKHPHLFK